MDTTDPRRVPLDLAQAFWARLSPWPALSESRSVYARGASLQPPEGLNLESQVRRDGPLPCSLAAWIACQLADVAALHLSGVADGALTASQIVLGSDGTITRSAPALERAVSSGSDSTDMPAVWHPRDAYSLGSTLYFLLTGACQPPEQDYRPMAQLRSDVPIGLELLCARLMTVSPEQAYGSADEVAAELLRWAPRGSVRRASRVSRVG